jgi:hypothetical protein
VYAAHILNLLALLSQELPPLERGVQALQRADASEAIGALEQAVREQPNHRAHTNYWAWRTS